MKIITSTGVELDTDLNNGVSIEDIAFGLSKQSLLPQLEKHYSVAEHCILLSRQVDPEDSLHALLYFASFSYSIMNKDRVPIREIIWEKYNITPKQDCPINAISRSHLIEMSGASIKKPSLAIEYYTPEIARYEYLLRYYQLQS